MSTYSSEDSQQLFDSYDSDARSLENFQVPPAVLKRLAARQQKASTNSNNLTAAPIKKQKFQSRVLGAPKEELQQIKRKKLAEVLEEGEISEEDEAEEEGEEQAISVPPGHQFLGDWRGASVKQMYGSVVMGLHVYKMKKSHRSGAPLIGKDGKILTQTSKYEFNLKEQEVQQLYKMLPQILAEMRAEKKKLEAAKAD